MTPQEQRMQQYNRSRILTASPAELTLLLYDGAIKFCNLAVIAIEKKDIQGAYDNIVRVQRILEEFRSTLNRDYPVAEDFDRVYCYLLKRLVDANMEKNVDILNEILEHLRSMRDTWKQVMLATKVS